MTTEEKVIEHDRNRDGLDRRGFLECMAWAGTGLLWTVTVLNGHIHQTMKKVEGHVMFHTAMSTAFAQPEPGKAPRPGPMKVEAGILRGYLGITDVNYIENDHSLAVVDSTLG